MLDRVIGYRQFIDQDCVAGRIENARNQVHQCRLAAAGAPNKRDRLAGFDRQINVLEYGCAVGVIAKRQIAKLNLAAYRRLYAGVWRVGNRRLDSGYRLHPLPTRRAPLVEIDDVADRNQRPNQPKQIHVEFGELADRELPARRQRHAGPDDQDKAEPDQERHQRPHECVDLDQPKVFLRVFVIQSIEGINLGAFLRVGAHDAHAGEILLSPRRDLREKILNLLKARVDLLPEKLHRQRDQRHRHEQQQRQLPTDRENDRHNHDDYEQSLQAVHDHRPDHLPHRGQIVGGAGH